MKRPVTITFRDRVGNSYTKNFKDSSEALERMQDLIKSELYTRQVAPTDSGGVRFRYNAELLALMKARLI